MLGAMLDWGMILKCHAVVPVRYWPVLWIYLARLRATMAQARADGRKGFMWHVLTNGVIVISHAHESRAEREARGRLPDDFDRTPWTRHETGLEPVFFARLARAAHGPFTTPSLHRDCTVAAPGPDALFAGRSHPGLADPARLHPP